jgi:hypothetical protein
MTNDILTYIGHLFILIAKLFVWLLQLLFVIFVTGYRILAGFCTIMLYAILAIFSGD